MKPKGIHWDAQSQVIRRGGLICTKKIKPDGADGSIQSLRDSDVESKEDKIEEARDHIAGWQDPHFQEFSPSGAFLVTDERGVPPGLVDSPIQAGAPNYCFELGTQSDTVKVNRAVGNTPSDISERISM